MASTQFRSQRITREYRQIIHAPPEIVFPLLCPVREAEWLDGWQYEMIYSKAGLVEEGAVFSTPGKNEADTVWVITKHDAEAKEVEFTRFTPESRVCVLQLIVRPKDKGESYVDISYTYTSLTPRGNAFVDRFTEEEFLEAVVFWEKSMNYFLEKGERLSKA